MADEGDRPVWEVPGRSFGRRLAARGIARWADLLEPSGEVSTPADLGRRYGGALTRAERDEYALLSEQLTAEEMAWRATRMCVLRMHVERGRVRVQHGQSSQPSLGHPPHTTTHASPRKGWRGRRLWRPEMRSVSRQSCFRFSLEIVPVSRNSLQDSMEI